MVKLRAGQTVRIVRAGKVVGTKRVAAKKPAKLSKPMRRAVQRIVRGNEETKYHAEQLLMKTQLDWGIHTYWSPSSIGDTMPLVPRIVQGDGSYQRIGSKVRPTRCRVDIEAAIAEVPNGITPLAGQWTNDIYLVMYLLRPKTVKNYQQFANVATTGADWTAELLDNGDGTSKAFGYSTLIGTTPYIYSNASDLQLPINREYWTLVKRKVVRLTKNYGQTNSDGTPQDNPNLGKSSYRGSFVYKLPTLKYDDDSKTVALNGGYPTNANMVLCIGAALANGCDSLQYGGEPLQPTGVLPNPLQLNVRTHYWYKDA